MVEEEKKGGVYPASINSYLEMEKIVSKGEGAHDAMVTLCRDKNAVLKSYIITGNVYIDNLSLHLINTEADTLKKLSYVPGVVKYLEHGEGVAIMSSGSEKKVYCISTEYLEDGTLFEKVTKLDRTLEELMRDFKDLVKIVKRIHLRGYAHLDIKLENIMFNRNSEIVVIDFGLSRLNNGNLMDYYGTPVYMAPEIIEGIMPFDGFKADIFSLGVLLFSMIKKIYPFKKANKSDEHYIHIVKGNYEAFWGQYEVIEDPIYEIIKELLQRMLAYEPTDRPTIEHILEYLSNY